MTAIDPLPQPPFDLRLLGAPELRDVSGASVQPILAQPKRLALLVRLALAEPDGVPRESLIQLLWPEMDEAHARNALRQSLHFLRRHLGASAVLATDTRVSLDAALVRCDVTALRRSFTPGGAPVDSVARCGPLCAGLHLTGAPHFAAWLEHECHRLADEIAAATATAAVDARPSASLAAAFTSRAPRTPRVRWRRSAMTWTGLAAATAVIATTLTVARPRATPRVEPDRVAVLPFTVRAGPELAYLREGMVDLLSTRLDGVPGMHMVDAKLAVRAAGDRSGARPSPSEVADRLGAGYALSGSVTDSAGQLIIIATLFRRGGGLEGSFRTTASAESGLFAAVDDVARELIRMRGTAERDERKELATRTTTSLDALRAWLEGEQAFRAGRYIAATDAFQRAVQLDSNFAIAHFRLGVAAAYATSGRSDVPRTELAAALRRGAQLGAHDRLMVTALFDDWHGAGDSALSLYQRAMNERPDDAEAWFGYADFLFHRASQRGHSQVVARPFFEKALALDTANLSAVTHLARIAALEGDLERLGAMARRERMLRTPSAVPGEVAWIDAVASLRTDSVTAMVAALAATTDDVAAEYAWRAATYGGDPLVAVRVMQHRIEGDRSRSARALNALALAHFETQRARPAAAATWIERARGLAPVPALYAEGSLLWAAAPSADVLQGARYRLGRWRTSAGIGSPIALPVSGGALMPAVSQLEMVMQAVLGNDSLLTRFVAICDRNTSRRPDGTDVLWHLCGWGRARHLTLVGDSSGALRQLEARARMGRPRGSVVFIASIAGLERARLLAAMGRADEALAALASVPEDNGHDAAVLASALQLRVQLFVSKGDLTSARRDGTRLLRMWRDAEPSERERVERVRQLLRGGHVVVAGAGGH